MFRASAHRPKRHTVRILMVTAMLALTAACESGPPPSPAEQALQHRFDMGCHHPGYKQLVSPYCGGGR